MDRDNMTRPEAEKFLNSLREEILAGEDPEEILYNDLGLEPDYIFDLLGFGL
jgi:hypothetical protein